MAKNEILVNLDCDNFTEKNGGEFIIQNMMIYGIHNTVIHQFSNIYGDGSYGRISLSKKRFLTIGGYDEDFYPLGYEDSDLLLRIKVIGLFS